MSSKYHTPVLLKACIEHLKINPSGVYVDLTFGGGGHSSEILRHLGDKGKLFAFDQDQDAVKNDLKDPRFTLIPQNFRYLRNYLRLHGVSRVNGILGDLGVSSHQFDEGERGFSIRFDAALDMRMNRQNPLTAKEVVNNYSDRQLLKIFREYGEVQNAGRLVKLIIEARAAAPVTTTEELKRAIEPCTPRFEAHKYLAKVFQALRIEVNQEMEVLRDCLRQCIELLESGGRLVVISYHSLEDRMVKQVIRSGDPDGNEEKDEVKIQGPQVRPPRTAKPVKKGVLAKGLSSVFSGTFLTNDKTLRHLPFLIFLAVVAVLYIANGYYADDKVREANRLGHQLKELRSEYISTKSELMFASKQSEVAKAATGLGLKEPVVPPIKIVVDSAELFGKR